MASLAVSRFEKMWSKEVLVISCVRSQLSNQYMGVYSNRGTSQTPGRRTIDPNFVCSPRAKRGHCVDCKPQRPKHPLVGRLPDPGAEMRMAAVHMFTDRL